MCLFLLYFSSYYPLNPWIIAFYIVPHWNGWHKTFSYFHESSTRKRQFRWNSNALNSRKANRIWFDCEVSTSLNVINLNRRCDYFQIHSFGAVAFKCLLTHFDHTKMGNCGQINHPPSLKWISFFNEFLVYITLSKEKNIPAFSSYFFIIYKSPLFISEVTRVWIYHRKVEFFLVGGVLLRRPREKFQCIAINIACRRKMIN